MSKTMEVPENLKVKHKSSLETDKPNSRMHYLLLVAGIFGITILGVLAYGLPRTSLNGMIVDDLTGKPLSANVKANGRTIQSNKQGRFVLNGRPGQIRLTFSRKGYESHKATFDIPFLVGKDIGKIRLSNVIIAGEIREDAVAPQTVTTATISIGDKSVDANNGSYVIGAPIGKHSLKVESPSRENFDHQISVKRGNNHVLIILSLTAKETARRYIQARQIKDYTLAYDYANADAKAIYLRDDYIEDKKKEDENGTFKIVSYTFGKTAIVHEWTFDKTGKTYKDVTEIDITITFKGAEGDAADGTSEHTMHEKLYFAKVEHQWKILSLNNLSP